MPELPSAERLKAIVAQYGASVERYQAFVADIAAGRGVSVAEYQKIKDAATKAGQAAGAVIAVAGAIAVGSQSAPVVGQVAGALAACVTFVAGLIQVFAPDSSTLSEQRAGVNLLGLEPPMSPGALLRTGWIRDSDTPAGCYYFDNIPIWGPDFDRFVASISSTDLRTLKAYRQLADLVHRWPYGPPEALALQIEVTTEELFLGLNRVGAKGTTLNYAPPYRVQWPTGVGGRPQYFETLDEIVAARGALPTQR